jgi:hypothetical protein
VNNGKSTRHNDLPWLSLAVELREEGKPWATIARRLRGLSYGSLDPRTIQLRVEQHRAQQDRQAAPGQG